MCHMPWTVIVELDSKNGIFESFNDSGPADKSAAWQHFEEKYSNVVIAIIKGKNEVVLYDNI